MFFANVANTLSLDGVITFGLIGALILSLLIRPHDKQHLLATAIVACSYSATFFTSESLDQLRLIGSGYIYLFWFGCDVVTAMLIYVGIRWIASQKLQRMAKTVVGLLMLNAVLFLSVGLVHVIWFNTPIWLRSIYSIGVNLSDVLILIITMVGWKSKVPSDNAVASVPS